MKHNSQVTYFSCILNDTSEPMAYKTLNKINAICSTFCFFKKAFLNIKNQTALMQHTDSVAFGLRLFCVVS